jgi:hypothetical protein
MATPSTAPASTLGSIVRVLYTQNPFYLIGTFLVLFGLQQSLGEHANLAKSGLLVGLLAAYVLLLAAVATVIIRYGKVWDDARTILLVIVLLFFMLSTSLDVHVLYQPVAGTLMLAGGLLFSVIVSEGLLRGLKIRLAPQYRGPYYLMLTLLFGYPVALAWLSRFDQYALLSWALFAFPALAALALLTLLPAARTARRREPASGTPWPWPYFPWSLFVYLTIGVTIRAWWLTIAFEPTEGIDTAFRPYYLAPLLLAWSALLVETGHARRSWVAVRIGMALPLAALLVAFPGRPMNPVEQQFLGQLVTAIGSPAQIISWSLLLFYGWTWLRRMPSAEPFVLALGGLAAFVGPNTLDAETFTAPQPLVILALIGGLFAQALRRESLWRALAAALLMGLSLGGSGIMNGSDALTFWKWHAPALASLWLVAIFDDSLARRFRALAWRASPCLAAVAAIVYPWTALGASPAAVNSYLALLIISSVALWFRQKEARLLAAAAGTLAANLAAHVRQVYLLLEHTTLRAGLPWLAAGLLLVALAFGISLLKMGLWQRGRAWLRQVNVALGGLSGPAG